MQAKNEKMEIQLVGMADLIYELSSLCGLEQADLMSLKILALNEF